MLVPIVTTVVKETVTTAASTTVTTAQDSSADTVETATTTAAVETVASFGSSDASYFDDALFIGDSRTVGLKDYGTLKNADYFCSIGLAAYKIDSEYVDGSTINDKLSSRSYGKIYVMLGINEVANDSEYTVSAFRNLLAKIREYQPEAVVYLAANLHVTTGAQNASITNSGIDELNYKLSLLADELENTYFININEVFDDETGSLTPDFTSDGVHVLGKYYETWCDWFCENTVIFTNSAAETAAEEVPEQPDESSENNEEPIVADESYDDGGSDESYDENYVEDYAEDYADDSGNSDDTEG